MQVYRGHKDKAHCKLQDLVEVSSHFCVPAAFTSWSGSRYGIRPHVIHKILAVAVGIASQIPTLLRKFQISYEVS
jgi:hypothetical protein